jgi:hypothetical protein
VESILLYTILVNLNSIFSTSLITKVLEKKAQFDNYVEPHLEIISIVTFS